MTKFSRIGFCALKRVVLLVFLALSLTGFTQEPKHPLSDDSRVCLECHGSMRYTFTDPNTGDIVSMKMYEEIRVDTLRYMNATHGGFSCTDCHSPDYSTHPHPIEVKFEQTYLCMDCHGDNDAFTDFHFETIHDEFQMSVHGNHLIENFSCWSCHNPHTYVNTARKGGIITDVVAYNNSMCLGCHGDISHYAVLIEGQLTNMLSKHEWLPNQSLHFRKVRCIDCHAATNDSILVAHHVLPANQAVKNCVDCHSTNSILFASLYKYQIIERRNKFGFFNAAITSEAYLIGGNRNYFFNIASIVIFGLVLVGIAIHASLRYIHYRRRRS